MTAATILVVDDEPAIRQFITELLQLEGYTVLTASDGAEALHLLNGGRPADTAYEAVLLDMMLPEVHGLEVLRHLADGNVSVPIVAMSASRRELDAAVEAGADAALEKPFEIDALLDCLQRVQG
ncbi:MAG TPA: response regulator [Chloroflexota bacterium]|nr:response regulator [Chloroflexota bacterium]